MIFQHPSPPCRLGRSSTEWRGPPRKAGLQPHFPEIDVSKKHCRSQIVNQQISTNKLHLCVEWRRYLHNCLVVNKDPRIKRTVGLANCQFYLPYHREPAIDSLRLLQPQHGRRNCLCTVTSLWPAHVGPSFMFNWTTSSCYRPVPPIQIANDIPMSHIPIHLLIPPIQHILVSMAMGQNSGTTVNIKIADHIQQKMFISPNNGIS